VGLQVVFTPEGSLNPEAAAAQRQLIASAGARMQAALGSTRYSLLRTYTSVPAIAVLLSPEAVDALQASGLASRIGQDVALNTSDAKSTPIVEATETAVFGRTGKGQNIAIVDTGVDGTHPYLQQTVTGPSKVVSEACFTSDSTCPNTSNSQTGSGAGAPCPWSSCEHGTHVAGIAAGKDTSKTNVGFNGVAPDANLVAVRVFSDNCGHPCAWASDILAGLNYVYGVATASVNPLAVASVNMSLGGGSFSTDCDTVAPWDTLKLAIDNLRSIGAATTIASGNDSNKSGVGAPACISTAITVGATNALNAPYSEFVAPFSNSSAQVELLAPGAGITSSVPGGGFAYMVGTSMATPHVAGAWAVLKQSAPGASVAALLSHLQATGLPITDSDNSVTVPRIRVLAASVRISDTGFVDAEKFTGAGTMGVISNGIGLGTRMGGPFSGSINISGVPGGSKIVAAYLYWMTLGGPNDTIKFQGQSIKGTLIGASQNACWPSVNPMGPNRVYRASLPASLAPGNGSYTVSGVGGSYNIDGQGASLVVIYAPPYLEIPSTSRAIVIRHGAMTLNAVGQTMSQTFSGLSVPKNPSFVELHIGMGNGNTGGYEDSMLFAGSPITSKGAFEGFNGPGWDAPRIAVPVSLLPAGTTSASNSLSLVPHTAGQCLAWAYSALSYKWQDGSIIGY
jgi:subtilisin family serine protease